MRRDEILADLGVLTERAVAHYWGTRLKQRRRHEKSGTSDQGLRGAVTGGAQMDGFIDLFADLAQRTGIPETSVYKKKAIQLPGYFRPTKEWDLLVVQEHKLIAAIEAKSQAGPSFGNNFNNRTEEAMGSALDLWTAYREHAYMSSPQPFVGYFFMLEDCAASSKAVAVREPHFRVFPEFIGASYKRRYELFCRKLVLERHYTASVLLTSSAEQGSKGKSTSPAEDVSMKRFAKVFVAHLGAFT